MFRRLREPGQRVRLTIDGREAAAAAGDSVMAALLAEGIDAFRRAPRDDAPRGPYCGMGVCFDCLVTIDGEPNRQACLATVSEGMRIETGGGRPRLAPGALP